MNHKLAAPGGSPSAFTRGFPIEPSLKRCAEFTHERCEGLQRPTLVVLSQRLRRELQMRAYSVDVEWMDASELARDFGREHPASEHAETWSRPLAEDDDVKPILEYRPHEVPTTSEAAADGGARDIPPLTSDQCSAIKGAMAGVRMAYQPQWAAAMPEEQWMGLVKEKASRQPRPALKP